MIRIRCVIARTVACVLLVVAILAGCDTGPPLGGAPDGPRLFAGICARCHGRDGKGEPVVRARLGVPDMTDPAWQSKLSDADIAHTVRHGSRSKKMPAFGNTFTDAQLRSLVRIVRGFAD